MQFGGGIPAHLDDNQKIVIGGQRGGGGSGKAPQHKAQKGS